MKTKKIKSCQECFKELVRSVLQFFGYHIEYYYPRGFIKFLGEYYQGGKDLVGAEIGIYDGRNTVDILKYLFVKKLYLIDPYQNYPEYAKTKDSKANQKKLENAQNQAFQRLSKFKDKVVWINEFSDAAYKKIPEKLDFIYIDANHNYEFIRRDIENYYPLLKRRGILAGHDIEPSIWPGVLFAFTDFVKEKNLPYRIIGADWIIINYPQELYKYFESLK